MIDNPLQKLLGKQFLITSFIEKRIQIVNFIKEGYDLNKPILINNRFLHLTAHIYYRSIIVDLYALFGPAKNTNKNSFSHISKEYRHLLRPGSCEVVRQWISKAREDIMVIQELRNKQVAHYDFYETESISLNFENLFRLNNLHELSKQIISYYGSARNDDEAKMGYDFGRRHHDLISLERLLKKAVEK